MPIGKIGIAKPVSGFSRKMESFIVGDTRRIPATPARLLLLDHPATRLPEMSAALDSLGPEIIVVADDGHQAGFCGVNLLLVNVTALSFESLRVIRDITATMALNNPHGRVLCISSVSRSARFLTEIEKCGARYVRIGDSSMLREAIDLAIFESHALATNKPRFLIAHRFSNGACMPGEEIASVYVDNDGQCVQMSLSLAQRFVFNFLAENRGIAMDSMQIAAGIAGNWFYRDHASKTGARQVKKIRPATVKVLVHRIRNAMINANTRFNPNEILRAIPIEGSRRVLYKLCAEVTWLHIDRDSQLAHLWILYGAATATKITTSL